LATAPFLNRKRFELVAPELFVELDDGQACRVAEFASEGGLSGTTPTEDRDPFHGAELASTIPPTRQSPAQLLMRTKECVGVDLADREVEVVGAPDGENVAVVVAAEGTDDGEPAGRSSAAR
jgi:hypothetical protein